MGFGDFLRSQRIANERGETTDDQYAANLEREAARRSKDDPENAKYLRSRARVVRGREQIKEIKDAKAQADAKQKRGLW